MASANTPSYTNIALKTLKIQSNVKICTLINSDRGVVCLLGNLQGSSSTKTLATHLLLRRLTHAVDLDNE